MATALMERQTLGSGSWCGLRRGYPAGGNLRWPAAQRRSISTGERERLLLAHLPQVHSIANGLRRRFPPHVSEEDLFHAGVVGLIEAVDRYDPRKSPGFHAFAELRIRGAIFDSLREMDWGPRRLRRCGRQLDRVRENLRGQFGRPADEFELARAMGLGIDEYRHLLAELGGLHLESLDDPSLANSVKFPEPRTQGSDPSALCWRVEIAAIVAETAGKLTWRERRVLALYYGEELTMKEVAGELGVAESRVCQLHAAALGKLRARIAGGCPRKAAAGKKRRVPVRFREAGVVSHEQRSGL